MFSDPRRSRRLRLVVLLPALSILLAGCLDAQPAGGPAEGPGSHIESTADAGDTELPVTNETGAIGGRVLDDQDRGLPGAHAALIGTDHEAESDAMGWFRFLNLAPGTYHLRVGHPQYRAAESKLEVAAGQSEPVVVRLLPLPGSAARDRPHVHDYWGDRQRVTVVDDVVPYHATNAGGYHGALQPVMGPANHVWTGDCLSGKENPSPATGPFRFAEPDQLVWPGTRAIEVRLDWTPQDYVGEKMSVIWHPANTREYKRGLLVGKGETFSIPVEPGEADLGHQRYTSWEFALCTSEKGETISYGRPAVGNVRIQMDLVRGADIPLEPAHPGYWANGSRTAIVNETKVFDGGEAAAWLLSSRGGRADFAFVPETGTIVPPGATQVEARLSWAYEGSIDLPPLSLSYSSSLVPPWEKWKLETREVPQPIQAEDGLRLYNVTVAEDAPDAVYQTISNWAFHWNFEGEERQDYALHPCGCRLLVHLEITAIGPEA